MQQGAGGELNPCLPFLPAPAPSYTLWGFGCTYMDLPAHTSKLCPHSPPLGPGEAVHTWEDESRKRPLQAQAPRYPELSMKHTHWRRARAGPGKGPPCSGLRAVLFTDALRWWQSTVTVNKCAAEIDMERVLLRLGLLFWGSALFLFSFRKRHHLRLNFHVKKGCRRKTSSNLRILQFNPILVFTLIL